MYEKYGKHINSNNSKLYKCHFQLNLQLFRLTHRLCHNFLFVFLSTFLGSCAAFIRLETLHPGLFYSKCISFVELCKLFGLVVMLFHKATMVNLIGKVLADKLILSFSKLYPKNKMLQRNTNQTHIKTVSLLHH